MKFATGAEKVAYYHEKKKNEVKTSKLNYYNENADTITVTEKDLGHKNPVLYQMPQSNNKNQAVKREKNRLYQVTFRKKCKGTSGKHTFKNRMEKCRVLKTN